MLQFTITLLQELVMRVGYLSPQTKGSLLAGTFAALVAIFVAQLTYRRSIRPILIFTHREGDWHVENIGVGPAIEVIVAYADDDKQWKMPTRYYPIAAKTHTRLLSVSPAQYLAVKYTDVHNKWYATECSFDKNRPLQQIFRKEAYKDWVILRSEREFEMLAKGQLDQTELTRRILARQQQRHFELDESFKNDKA